MIELLDRPAWMKSGLCTGTDPEVFHPGRGTATRKLRQVCRACPVRAACASHGVTERHGVWGGVAERGRRTLRATGELVDPDGDVWVLSRTTGEVVVVESDTPRLDPAEARLLLASLQPAAKRAASGLSAVAGGSDPGRVGGPSCDRLNPLDSPSSAQRPMS